MKRGHGPHDHEVRQATRRHGDAREDGADDGHGAHGRGGTTRRIAVATALMATVASIFSYLGGATQADASLLKNNAAITMTEAANQWNRFQAKSTRQAMTEFALDAAPGDRRPALADEIGRCEGEKDAIESAARGLEASAREWDRKSDQQLHQHHRWAQATTLLQVAIAMAAMALLARRRWLECVMVGLAVAGVAVGIAAGLHL